MGKRDWRWLGYGEKSTRERESERVRAERYGVSGREQT